MTDPNVTAPVTIRGVNGTTVLLNGDYGGLAVRGDAVLHGEQAWHFLREGARILRESQQLEAERLAAEEVPDPRAADGIIEDDEDIQPPSGAGLCADWPGTAPDDGQTYSGEPGGRASSLVGRLVEDAHDDSPCPTVGLVTGQVDEDTLEVLWGEQRFVTDGRPSREPFDALRPAREASRPFPMVAAGQIAAEAADFARHIAGKG